MNQIDAGGHRIAYERKGEGPPLVFLHGYVGDRRTWRRQIEDLSDEFTVVAWDARLRRFIGSARSLPPSRLQAAAAKARLLLAGPLAAELYDHLVGAGPTGLSRFGRWSWAMPVSVERSAKP
jgi:hypothetical protein